MVIFLPVEYLIRLLGLKLTLMCFITLMLTLINAVPFFGSTEAALLSAVILYFFVGLTLTFSRQENQFNSIINNIDPVSFDYRSLKFDTLLSKNTSIALLQSFRELSRINQQQKNQLKEVNYSANQVIETTISLSKNVEKQFNATSSTAAAIVEMNQSISEVSSKISAVHSSAKHADKIVQSGQSHITSLSGAILEVSKEVSQTQKGMQDLDELAQEVTLITKSIRKISSQINLLGLNASIEAARAGSFGRGFAVVAEEVRNLAISTNSSSDHIANIINQVLNQSSITVASMKLVFDKTNACGEKAKNVNKMLEKIALATDTVQQETEVVSVNAEQQVLANEEISRHVEQIVQSSEANADIAKQTELVAEHLRKLTH
ncbi:MAG: methyl-accepting chemotaxis protein [Polaribacter sp.]|jgi:methyl-accepting chemotaxis protein